MGARSIETLRTEADRLVEEGLLAEAVTLDVTDAGSVEEATAALPDLDGLVVVAGVNVRKAFETYTEEEYARILDTNLHAAIRLARSAGTTMLKRGRGGKIVFIGSSNQVTSLPYLALYSMTKSALGGLTRALAAEWGQYDIQVNCVAPGLIWTDLTGPGMERSGYRRLAGRGAAHPPLGHTGGHRADGGLPARACLGLRDRPDPCRRRRLHDDQGLALPAGRRQLRLTEPIPPG